MSRLISDNIINTCTSFHTGDQDVIPACDLLPGDYGVYAHPPCTKLTDSDNISKLCCLDSCPLELYPESKSAAKKKKDKDLVIFESCLEYENPKGDTQLAPKHSTTSLSSCIISDTNLSPVKKVATSK